MAGVVEQTVQQAELLRQRVADAQPDALLVVGHDHLNQLFMNNMPAFLLGKMDRYDGTVDHEVRMYGLPRCVVPGDATLARALLEGGLDRGIDFAYSDELVLDHSIVVPLLMLRPAIDLPIVPLLSNCMAPPVPRASRFLQVGRALRQTLEALPGTKRVAAILSGHLSLEMGGPTQLQPGACDPAFDARFTDCIRRGDVAAILSECTPERLTAVGNLTSGVLNYVLGMGLADCAQLSHGEVVDTPRGASPFYVWEPA